MKPSPARIARVRFLKRLLPIPMTWVEKALYRSQVAAKDAERFSAHDHARQLSIPCEPAGTM